IAQAYHGIQQIEFSGIYYRRDIGHRVLKFDMGNSRFDDRLRM
ncbi:hypothetical protein FLX35_04725, partial [Cylindrospermopsis raciborskii LB2897]|nr:hypothetical protein [Cylindrospermopsis raciborskii LB2897]